MQQGNPSRSFPCQIRFAALTMWLLNAPSLCAQGVVGPFILGRVPHVSGLNAGQVPAASVVRVHMVHLPTSAPNLYYCSLGVTGLAASLGGAGQTDILCGTYNALTDVFTPNMDAAALNTGGHEYNMVVHSDGLIAAYDYPNNGAYSPPFLVARALASQPWQVVGPVNGLPCCGGGSYTPAPAMYRGQLQLVYADPRTGEIRMAALDLGNASIRQPRVIVAPSAGTYCTSPVPICSAQGEIIGVSHGVVSGSVIDVDHYMSLDLDPATPSVLVSDTGSWTTPGGFVGGRFFGHEFAPGAPQSSGIYSMDAYWTTGGRAQGQGSITVSAFCVPTAAAGSHWSMMCVSTSFLATSATNPLVQGWVGVDLLTAWTGAVQQHANNNGEAKFTFTVPSVAALSGARLPVQSVTWSGLSAMVHLGNTAVMVID